MSDTTNISGPSINQFWEWFKGHYREFEELLCQSDTQGLDRSLSPRIHELSSRLGWEIGPGVATKFGFSITLNKDPSNVHLAEQVIAQAPQINNWEFHVGKPPKRWDFRVNMRNARGQRVTIDANNWRYCLIGFDNCSFFDIKIIAPYLPPMDESAREQAADIVLESVLGEKVFLERIERVQVISGTDVAPCNEEDLSSIKVLDKHIASLVSK